jgi:hypothetical protein
MNEGEEGTGFSLLAANGITSKIWFFDNFVVNGLPFSIA